jgi:hypothetical protein
VFRRQVKNFRPDLDRKRSPTRLYSAARVRFDERAKNFFEKIFFSLDSGGDFKLSAADSFSIDDRQSSSATGGWSKMDPLKHSWPGLGTECPFCSHSKCRACLEVSVNVLACCNCRTRAIRRLAYLKDLYRMREQWRDQEPQLASPDGKTDAGDGAIRPLKPC